MATNEEKIEALNLMLNTVDAIEVQIIQAKCSNMSELRLSTIEEIGLQDIDGVSHLPPEYQNAKKTLIEMLEELQAEELAK